MTKFNVTEKELSENPDSKKEQIKESKSKSSLKNLKQSSGKTKQLDVKKSVVVSTSKASINKPSSSNSVGKKQDENVETIKSKTSFKKSASKSNQADTLPVTKSKKSLKQRESSKKVPLAKSKSKTSQKQIEKSSSKSKKSDSKKVTDKSKISENDKETVTAKKSFFGSLFRSSKSKEKEEAKNKSSEKKQESTKKDKNRKNNLAPTTQYKQLGVNKHIVRRNRRNKNCSKRIAQLAEPNFVTPKFVYEKLPPSFKGPVILPKKHSYIVSNRTSELAKPTNITVKYISREPERSGVDLSKILPATPRIIELAMPRVLTGKYGKKYKISKKKPKRKKQIKKIVDTPPVAIDNDKQEKEVERRHFAKRMKESLRKMIICGNQRMKRKLEIEEKQEIEEIERLAKQLLEETETKNKRKRKKKKQQRKLNMDRIIELARPISKIEFKRDFTISKSTLEYEPTENICKLATPTRKRAKYVPGGTNYDEETGPPASNSYEILRNSNFAHIKASGIEKLSIPRFKREKFVRAPAEAAYFPISKSALKYEATERLEDLAQPKFDRGVKSKPNPYGVSKKSLRELTKEKKEIFDRLSKPKVEKE